MARVLESELYPNGREERPVASLADFSLPAQLQEVVALTPEDFSRRRGQLALSTLYPEVYVSTLDKDELGSIFARLPELAWRRGENIYDLEIFLAGLYRQLKGEKVGTIANDFSIKPREFSAWEQDLSMQVRSVLPFGELVPSELPDFSSIRENYVYRLGRYAVDPDDPSSRAAWLRKCRRLLNSAYPDSKDRVASLHERELEAIFDCLPLIVTEDASIFTDPDKLEVHLARLEKHLYGLDDEQIASEDEGRVGKSAVSMGRRNFVKKVGASIPLPILLARAVQTARSLEQVINNEEETRREPIELDREGLALTSSQAQKINSAILAERDFWLTNVYSLAMHNQDLLEHAAALEARIKNMPETPPIPRTGEFHHPERIRLNATSILKTELTMSGNDKHGHVYKYESWTVLLNSLAVYNLQLLRYVEEMQESLGINNHYERSKKNGRLVLTEEEQIALAHASMDEVKTIATEKNADVSVLIGRRNTARHWLGMLGAEQLDEQDIALGSGLAWEEAAS